MEKKPQLVNPKKVCLHNKMWGDLGVKRHSYLNLALICNWSWWFANERGTLWTNVTKKKHGEERGYGVRALQEIVMVWACGKPKKWEPWLVISSFLW